MAKNSVERPHNTKAVQMIEKIIRLVILCSLILPICACGRKGPPKPPEDFAPVPVMNLNITGSVQGLTLTWDAQQNDTEEEEEAELRALKHFSIQKSLYSRDDKNNFEEIAVVDVTDPTTTNYSYLDKDVEPGKIYNYQVLTQNEQRVSGEPLETLRSTFLGESSRIERIVLESKREKRVKPGSTTDDNTTDFQ